MLGIESNTVRATEMRWTGEAGGVTLSLVPDGTERRWFSFTPESRDPAEEQSVSVLADTVIWDEFHGHGATQPPEPVRFEFERDDYEAQLEGLPRVAVTLWDAETSD